MEIQQSQLTLNKYKMVRHNKNDTFNPSFKRCSNICTRWFKYDRDDLCVSKSQFVPVIFEPPCILIFDALMIFNFVADEWKLVIATTCTGAFRATANRNNECTLNYN